MSRGSQLRKLVFSLSLLTVAVGANFGCATKEPVLWGEAHLKRMALTTLDGFHYPNPLNPVPFDSLHRDVDRIVYGLEAHPGETWSENLAREGQTIVHGFHRLQLDWERILLDMPEYPLESDY